jgi:glycosidase
MKVSRYLIAIIVLSAMPAWAAEPAGLRVEPPSWWLGFGHRTLQLMISGEQIAGYEVEIDYPGITIAETASGDSPNYLFVYLEIGEDAVPGSVDLDFERAGAAFTVSFPLLERSHTPDTHRGFTPADVIYLVTPDRYANGRVDNDAVPGYADAPDRADPYGRHGGDLAGLRQRLDYIADMGFTMLWLNPVLENAMPEASYHGYAITDHYRIDPRFGSNEDYRALADEARSRGIGIVMDMVENHIGSGHPWMKDLPTRDWLNSAGAYRETNHARTTNQGPYASSFDRAGMADGWFAPTMPDLNQRNPHLAEYLIQNAIWWIEYAGLAGIRQDTWPYPDKYFMSEWTRRILEEYPELNIVGEEWSLEPAIIAYWQAGKQNHDGYVSWLPSLFDFPLQDALRQALTAEARPWGSVWTPVYETLATDFLYPDPFNLVIFPDNHDMSRIATQLDEDPDLVRMALVFVATMRGIPQIFYGTEIGMAHPGTDSHGVIRSDFPGGWPGDRQDAFSSLNLDRDAADLQGFVRRLLNWRRGATAVHDGALMQFAPLGQAYVYARYTEDEVVIVAFNRSDETAVFGAERYRELLGERSAAVDILTGDQLDIGEGIVIPPMSTLLLEVAN